MAVIYFVGAGQAARLKRSKYAIASDASREQSITCSLYEAPRPNKLLRTLLSERELFTIRRQSEPIFL
jgi:hypothetical protein